MTYRLTRQDVESERRALSAAADWHPDDHQIQLAHALTAESGSAERLERLRALVSRFPENVSLYANLLRYEMSAVKVRRDAEYWLDNQPVPGNARDRARPASPEQLAAFDRTAAEGERLDPDNAYFPLMRSIGLFAAHRNEEALAAIQRASKKLRWEEYHQDEVAGSWRLREEALGGRSAFLRFAVSAAISFPQYAGLCSAARLAIYHAAQMERAGRAEEGLAIRRALMKCGSLMRVQSPSLVDSLAGIAITEVATARPGGDAPAKSERGLSYRQRVQKRLGAYCAYLHRMGHADEARWVRAEFGAGQRVRAIGSQGTHLSPLGGLPLLQLVAWWAFDLFTLSNVLWMLLFGGAAALLSRSQRLRVGEPLPGYVRQGITAALLTLIGGIILIIGALADPPDSVVVAGYGVMLCLLASLAVLAVRSFSGRIPWRRMGPGSAVFALALLGPLPLLTLALWQARAACAFFDTSLVIVPFADGGNNPPSVVEMKILSMAGALAVPLMTALVLGIASRIVRVPLSVGLVRGFHGLAVPIACVLLLAYGGLVLGTLRQEIYVNNGLERGLQHEGRYLAELAGKEWPGAVH